MGLLNYFPHGKKSVLRARAANRLLACHPTSRLKCVFPVTEVKYYPAHLRIYFLDREYHYKSIPTQISHDAGSTPLRYTYRKSPPPRDLTITASSSNNEWLTPFHSLYLQNVVECNRTTVL